MIEDIKANKIQLTKNHTDTLGLGNAIANVWGEEGRGLFILIRSQREGYDEYKQIKLLMICFITTAITSGTDWG